MGIVTRQSYSPYHAAESTFGPSTPCSEDFSLSAERREECIRAREEIGAFAAKE